MVTGKGGVGKTTVAAALGLVAARAGRRVIVAEVARRGDVASVLAPAGDGGTIFAETAIADGLWHISIDPQDALEEYLRDQLAVTALAELLARSRTFGLLAAATPGLRELLTAGKVWELCQPQRRTPGARPYDLVVCDAPATGHALALLRAPRTFADAAAAGPIARQGRLIHATFTDPGHTGVVAVSTATELAVTETGALRDGLRERLGLEAQLVVANALEPDRFTPAEAGRLAEHGDDGPGGRAVAAARAAHATALRQRAQLARLRRLTDRAPVRLRRRPDARGGADLPALADELAAALPVGSAP